MAGPGTPGTQRAYTGPNGAYSFSGLAPGQYVLCAEVPVMYQATPLLDGCAWDHQRVSVTLAQGASASRDIVVARGAELRVGVTDAARNLSGFIATPATKRLALSIIGPQGLSLPLRMVSSQADRQEYAAVVPVGMAVRLMADSLQHDLNDSQDRPAQRLTGLTATQPGSLPAIEIRLRPKSGR